MTINQFSSNYWNTTFAIWLKHCFAPWLNFHKPYSVKMAKYWPPPFLHFYCPPLCLSPYIFFFKNAKNNLASTQPSWPNAWSTMLIHVFQVIKWSDYTFCSGAFLHALRARWSLHCYRKRKPIDARKFGYDISVHRMSVWTGREVLSWPSCFSWLNINQFTCRRPMEAI